MSVLSLSLGKKTGRLPERRRPAFPMVALALLFSLLALLPLGFVVAVGFDTGWPTIKALVFRPRVGELLSNTLWLTVLAVPISIVLGVTLAWLTERTALAGRQLWSALAVAPLAIPAFVQSYAWVSAVPSLHGLSAGVFLSVLAYCRWRPCCAASIPPLKMSPRRWARRRGKCSSGWCSRSCVWQSAAVRCWWPCICWRNMACM